MDFVNFCKGGDGGPNLAVISFSKDLSFGRETLGALCTKQQGKADHLFLSFFS